MGASENRVKGNFVSVLGQSLRGVRFFEQCRGAGGQTYKTQKIKNTPHEIHPLTPHGRLAHDPLGWGCRHRNLPSHIDLERRLHRQPRPLKLRHCRHHQLERQPFHAGHGHQFLERNDCRSLRRVWHPTGIVDRNNPRERIGFCRLSIQRCGYQPHQALESYSQRHPSSTYGDPDRSDTNANPHSHTHTDGNS